jgi:hypothetical protein
VSCFLENTRLFVSAFALLEPSNNVGLMVPNNFQARDEETTSLLILGAGPLLRLLPCQGLSYPESKIKLVPAIPIDYGAAPLTNCE